MLRTADYLIAGMNLTEEEAAALYPPRPVAPREVAQDRIVTVRIPRLDRNERARLRRWLARLPTGARDPRVVYRLGWRDGLHGQRDSDFLHVVAPARRSIFCPSPREHAERTVAAVLDGAKIDAGGWALAYVCSHQSPGRPWAAPHLYEWADGEITWTRVRDAREAQA